MHAPSMIIDVGVSGCYGNKILTFIEVFREVYLSVESNLHTKFQYSPIPFFEVRWDDNMITLKSGATF